LDEALQGIETNSEHQWDFLVRLCRGDAFCAKGDLISGHSEYDAALFVARRQEAKLWELRASVRIAKLSRDQGKRDEARDLLAPVYGWFTEGFDTLDLKEAKALLDELAEAPERARR
jgi:predicted negative regulator of RcsB-dependent stress response